MNQDHEYYSLLKENQRLKDELLQEKCAKHYYLGYARGVARGLEEPAKSRALEAIEKEKENDLCQIDETSEDSDPGD